jgi:DNA primase
LPNRIERDSLANDIAQKLGIDSALLRMEFRAAAGRRSSSPNLGTQAAPDAQITPAEKILVRAVSSPAREDAGLRRRASDVLAVERLHMGLGVESLLEALLAGAGGTEGGGPAADPMALPLSEGDRALLTRIIMRQDDAELLTAELLEGALEALRHRAQLAQRENEIKRGIVEAERANDVAALLRLKQEKLELDRKLAGE